MALFGTIPEWKRSQQALERRTQQRAAFYAAKDREEADRVTCLLILVAVVHFAIDHDKGTPANADEGLVAAVEDVYAHGKIWDDCGPTKSS